MLKLRFSKPNVKSHNNGKIVIVRYDCTLWDNETKEVKIKFQTSGTAKRAEGDVDNPEFARSLADSRAKECAYKVAKNGFSNADIKALERKVQWATEMISFHESMKYLHNKEKEHIDWLINENYN